MIAARSLMKDAYIAWQTPPNVSGSGRKALNVVTTWQSPFRRGLVNRPNQPGSAMLVLSQNTRISVSGLRLLSPSQKVVIFLSAQSGYAAKHLTREGIAVQEPVHYCVRRIIFSLENKNQPIVWIVLFQQRPKRKFLTRDNSF